MTVLNFTLKTDEKGNQYLEDTTFTRKKITGKSITLGSTTLKEGGVSTKILNAEINIIDDIDGQVRYDKKGNDIVITIFKKNGDTITDAVLGKITLKNIGTKKFVEAYDHGEGDYKASLDCATAEASVDDFFGIEYNMQYKDINKAISLTGTYLDENFLGGNGNDTIKAVGGTNTINGGRGFDKMHAGEGEDEFIINKGDATLIRVLDKDGNFKKYNGTGDIIYKSGSADTLTWDSADYESEKYTKEKNNLVIEKTYIDDEIEQVDKVTIDKFFDPKSSQMDLDIAEVIVNGSGKIDGTKYTDLITGSKNADKITTGEGDDKIFAGKGNDTITLDRKTNTLPPLDYGLKFITMDEGDGNDTVIVNGVAREDANVDLDMSANLDDVVFTYTKNYQDLIITAKRAYGSDLKDLNESVTLKNYFDAEVPLDNILAKEGDFGYVELNGNAIDISSGAEKITIGSVKISQLLNDLKYGDDEAAPTVAEWLKKNGYKVPGALTGAKIFLGTEYDDSYTGTTGKDLMVSTDGDENEFTTGKGGQTGIVALGNSDDIYNVNSFKSTGTGIYDENGEYTLNIAGANTNDLHMIKTDLDFLSAYNKTTILGHDVKNIESLTTTDGIKKVASLDLRKIGANLKTIYDDKTSEAAVKAVNTLLGLTPSILNNLKGVSVVTGEEDFEFQDINITDKEEVISKETQIAIQEKTSKALENFMAKTASDYDLILDSKSALANVLFGVSEQSKQLSNKEYKEIKDGFFNMFKNLYTGTSGDNSYTIKKADYVAIASGEGSDTFTFNGEIGEKFPSDSDGNGPKYEIISALKEGEKDTIRFTGLSLGESLTTEGLKFGDTGHVVKGANFQEEKSSSTYAMKSSVSYSLGEEGEGYDLSEKDFNLTIKDKSRTYDVTAEYKEGDIDHIWAAKTNNIAYLFSDEDIKISSSNGFNAVFADNNADFRYEYANGHDFVKSNGDSNGTYEVELSSKTDLNIKDKGCIDDDTLILKNNLSDVKLFFNVKKNGEIDKTPEQSIIGEVETGFDFIYTKKLAKSNFVISKDDTYVKNGADVNLNLSGIEEGMETVICGGKKIDFESLVDDIQGQVTAWLNGDGKGYLDVYDVLSKGNSTDINTVLGYYNKDLGNYVINE